MSKWIRLRPFRSPAIAGIESALPGMPACRGWRVPIMTARMARGPITTCCESTDLRLDHFIKRYGDYAHAAGTSVTVTPQATRRIEVIAQPQTPFSRAIVASAPTGNPVSVPIVDSYDSTDITNYPKRPLQQRTAQCQHRSGVNATVYINAPISSFNATLYGSLETNGGTVTSGEQHQWDGRQTM